MADPLLEAFFTPTSAPAGDRPVVRPADFASAAPVRTAGTRSRAGNAMNRTRAALLDGAYRAVRASGTKITMGQVAAAAGVAKATLYNHFRTREAVLAALLSEQTESLARQLGELPLADALSQAAHALATHPLVRALAQLEPATLARLGCIDPAAPAWERAADATERLLAAHGRGGAELVLRWLASYLLTPASDAAIAADLAILLAALPDVEVAASNEGYAEAGCGEVDYAEVSCAGAGCGEVSCAGAGCAETCYAGVAGPAAGLAVRTA